MGLSKRQEILSWILQLVSAFILAKASSAKFLDDTMAVLVFHKLGIDDTIYVIATIEGAAALLLFTKRLSHYGAILGFGVMMGALIAHISVLGLEVNHDGGRTVILMSVVSISTALIMWLRRKKLPLIGNTF